MLSRFGSRRSWLLICLGVVLLGVVLLGVSAVSVGLVETEYRATYYAEPIAADNVQAPVSFGELPPKCQQVAQQLVAGQTVFEEGYELRVGSSPLYVTHTNTSHSWHLGGVICGDYIGRELYVDGQYYQIWGGGRKGAFWYLHKSLLSKTVMMGIVLIFGGVGLGLKRPGVK